MENVHRTTSIPQVYVGKAISPVPILPKPTRPLYKPITSICVPRPASLRLKNKTSCCCASSGRKEPRGTILLDQPLPLKKRRGRPPSNQRKQKTNTKSVDKKRLMNSTKTELKCLINNIKPKGSNSAGSQDDPTQEIHELDVDVAPNHEVYELDVPIEYL